MAGRRKSGYGARSFLRASDAVRGLTRPAFSKRGFAESRLITEWDAVVGVEIAALCRPLRLSFASSKGFGGTLTVGVLGANGLEVQHLQPQIIERVNGHYGFRAVSRLALQQVGSEALTRPGASGNSPQPRPEVVARLSEEIGTVRDEGLRAALEKLARNVAARPSDAERDITSKEQSEP